MLTLCRFEPRDTLLFRDNRPATAGDALRFRFPLPSVPFGALRTHWLYCQDVDTEEYRGGKNPAASDFLGEASPDPVTGRLWHHGPFLWQDETLFLPAPSVLLGQKVAGAFGEKPRWAAALPGNAAGCWNLEPFRPVLSELGLEPVGGWLSLAGWEHLLTCGLSPDMGDALFSEWRDVSCFFELETRFGHFREDSTRVVLGALGGSPASPSLYWAEHVRFRNGVALASLVDVEGLTAGSFPFQDGAIALGGEKRRVDLVQEAVERPFAALQTDLVGRLDGSGRVFCALLTPAMLRPHPQSGVPRPSLSGPEPVAAAVGEPEFFSGWDLALRAPKALQAAVPAGSVFFYEGVDQSTFKKWLTDYALRGSVSAHLQRGGFGTALFGLWRT